MGSATAAASDKVNRVKIYDHTQTQVIEAPVTSTVCKNVKVPIYEQVQRQGNAAEGALAGMIIGGILGKGVTGKDDGAAAGAVIGGLIGADKGSQPKSENVIVGYEYVEQCQDKTTYRRTEKEVYSHSTIRFYIGNKRYVLKFIK